jgi:hypothetical protein
MKITKKLLIVGAVVLAFAVIASPVLAFSKIIWLEPQDVFSVRFQLGSCTLDTTEYSTKHWLFGRPIFSTNVGFVNLTGPCPIDLGWGPIDIGGISVPFGVLDVRNPNPANDIVIKSLAMVAPLDSAALPPGLVPPGLVRAGANAWLVRQGPPHKYLGYAYLYHCTNPVDLSCEDKDYLVIPFMAEGSPKPPPDVGFTITLLEHPRDLKRLRPLLK